MKGINESILQIIFKGHKSISFIDYKNNTSEKLQAIPNSFGIRSTLFKMTFLAVKSIKSSLF